MCGIVGIMADTVGTIEEDIFERLLMISSFRGMHSTGIVKVDDAKNVRSIRSIEPSPRFVFTKQYDEFITPTYKKASSKRKTHVLLGHTRHATKGEITVKNAHPFSFSNVVGVHNGTIKKAFEGSSKYDTDSEAFFAMLNDKPLKECLEEVAAFDSAYAFVWVDKRDNTLNFVKNSRRPLWFTYMFTGRTLIWASTKDMLQFIVGGKTITNHKKETTNPYFTLNPHDHMKFDIGSIPLETMDITDLEVKENPTVSYRHGAFFGDDTTYDYGGYSNDDGWVTTPGGTRYYKGRSSATRVVPGHKLDNRPKDENTDEEDRKMLQWLGRADINAKKNEPTEWTRVFNGVLHILGFQGKYYPVSEIRKHLSEGCSACGEPVALFYKGDDGHDDVTTVTEDYKDIRWSDRRTYYCGNCFHNSEGNWVQCSMSGNWNLWGENGVAIH